MSVLIAHSLVHHSMSQGMWSENYTLTMVSSFGPCGATNSNLPSMFTNFSIAINGNGAGIFVPGATMVGVGNELEYSGGCLMGDTDWSDWPCRCTYAMGFEQAGSAGTLAASCTISPNEPTLPTHQCTGIYSFGAPKVACTGKYHGGESTGNFDLYCSPSTALCVTPFRDNPQAPGTPGPAHPCKETADCTAALPGQAAQCDPFAGICVAGANEEYPQKCVSSCADSKSYCNPNLGHCLTPGPAGVLCSSSVPCASSGTVCDPLLSICVIVGDACTSVAGNEEVSARLRNARRIRMQERAFLHSRNP